MTTQPNADNRPKVLIAWDGSPAGATALPVARAVAEQLEAQLQVLHVATEWVDHNELRVQLGLAADDIRLRVELGRPEDEILRVIDDPEVALVVITTHGREVGRDGRLGGVTAAVVAHTTRAVLIVRPAGGGPPSGDLRRLLLPLDGTPSTAAALEPVMTLAQQLGASLDLLYVAGDRQPGQAERGSIGAPRYLDQPQHEWPQWAAEVIDRLAACCAGCPPEVPVRMFLAQGDIGEEIARFARQHESDAIVLVRRSRFQPGRAAVLRAILRTTPCPILLVGGPVK